MKKPDPSRFTGKKEKKADELEMRGFSSPAQTEDIPVSPITEVEKRPDTKVETKQPRHHDTTVSRYQDTLIEDLRKAVKEFGKEAATHRFTEAEKQVIAEIVFKYRKQGIKTSENEITRIAINFIAKDHSDNNKESLLDKVLTALNE